jgi:hypothetical protein
MKPDILTLARAIVAQKIVDRLTAGDDASTLGNDGEGIEPARERAVTPNGNSGTRAKQPREPFPDLQFHETDHATFRAAYAENERRVRETDLAWYRKHIARLNAILIAKLGSEEFARQHGTGEGAARRLLAFGELLTNEEFDERAQDASPTDPLFGW